MTREEAKKRFWEDGGVFSKMFMYCLKSVLKCPYKGREIDIFIDEIYDDFESRICKNCEYYKNGICVCDNSLLVAYAVDKDFGCNKFKKKNK